jgi:hypothetical protein
MHGLDPETAESMGSSAHRSATHAPRNEAPKTTALAEHWPAGGVRARMG